MKTEREILEVALETLIEIAQSDSFQPHDRTAAARVLADIFSYGEGPAPEQTDAYREQGDGHAPFKDQNLPPWRSHKIVRAAKIALVQHGDGQCVLQLAVGDGEPLLAFPVDRSYVEKHKPQMGDYLVIYEDGYRSWSPAMAFEGGYTPLVEHAAA